MLLEQGHPARRSCARTTNACAVRRAGAEVFVGDLLTVADVTAALQSVRRICFSMSL
ncbi:hypothetical protein [Streptomyces sp. NPDC006334]|uniref:hypothetical protein n=1 Tax=Streptomyces sp. NPDC006334 TaxID=3156754 RepID=UPI0033A87BD2